MFIVIRGPEKEVSSKEWNVSGKVTFLWGRKGSLELKTSLVRSRQFQMDWLKITSLGEAETAIRSGIKSWFADVDLAQVTPFGVCCLFFNMRKDFPGHKVDSKHLATPTGAA